jgi:hypothetical protein
MSILLTDILYFASVDPKLQPVVQEAYRQNPVLFENAVGFIFDLSFQNKLRSMVKLPLIENVNQVQIEINAIHYEIAQHHHLNLSEEGYQLMAKKGITEDQINQYLIGDNLEWEQKDFEPANEFREQLLKNYDEGLVNAIFFNLANSMHIAREKYGSGHALSYPSLKQGKLAGVVYRNVGFHLREGQVRNTYKFYSPYSYSFLFNEDALEQYDELNLVEGITDALSLIRRGYPNTVSPSMIRLSERHIEKLRGKKLNVLFDRDMGGLSGLKFIQKQLPNSDLKTLALTPTGVDFDEISDGLLQRYMSDLAAFDIRQFQRS